MTADELFMRRALRLAARARGRTAPNPMVGAVVVRDGQVVGEGWHRKAGSPHAEVYALRQAGEAARGASLYVTLEPCCHHGRTPPCTDAVLGAGISRVVAAMGDPFPKVSGGGLRQLNEAGLRVECGVLEAEARELNRAYVKAVLTGLPWVTLKMAVTLDGRTATRTGDSRWVTGEAARRHVHQLRSWHDAVMVGAGTVRSDDPQLTARIPAGRHPLRVVVDARAELSPESFLARSAAEIPILVAVGEGARTQALEAGGVEIERIPLVGGRVDLSALLSRMAERGVHSVLCEGGAVLAGSLLDADLVDEVAWFVAPKLVGDAAAPGALNASGAERMADARALKRVTVRRFGADVGIFGYLHEP